MIDYSKIYTKYTDNVELSHIERFNVLLFMVYVQTRNIPLHLFHEAYTEYKTLVSANDLKGVDNFLQHLKMGEKI